MHVQQDEEKCGDPDGEAEDIDRRDEFVAPENAE